MFRSLSSILTAARTIGWPQISSILASFLCAAKAFPADVTLAWDANSEPNLGGYELHWGQSSGNYTQSRDVGNVTTYIVTGTTPSKRLVTSSWSAAAISWKTARV